MPDREKSSLSREIHRSVSGLLIDVESFKMNPHRMRRVREAAVCECVGNQKVAEFVVGRGLRDR